MPRTQQKRQDRSHKNYQSDIGDLFSEGMGVDPTSDHEVGQRMPKIGVVAKNSQKFFNQQRDLLQSQGTLKLAYEREESIEIIKRGVKVVDKRTLPYFVTNEYEKKNISDPDANHLFDAKKRTKLGG